MTVQSKFREVRRLSLRFGTHRVSRGLLQASSELGDDARTITTDSRSPPLHSVSQRTGKVRQRKACGKVSTLLLIEAGIPLASEDGNASPPATLERRDWACSWVCNTSRFCFLDTPPGRNDSSCAPAASGRPMIFSCAHRASFCLPSCMLRGRRPLIIIQDPLLDVQ